jgi:phospholipid-binding lipoprotein MlaA
MAVRPSRLTARAFALSLLAVCLAGCASKDSTTYDERDPFEPVNRVIFNINDLADRIVFRQAAYSYELFVPSLARRGVNNFFSNLGTVRDMVNNFLQGKPRRGLSDAARFGLNTTLGWGGLFDPATDAGLAKHNEDFGQTLGVWGLPPGPYLMLPLLGPQTTRSTVGFVVDRQYSLLFNYNNNDVRTRLLILNIVRIRANLLFLNEQLDRAYDPYVFVRDAILQRRRFLRYDGRVPPETNKLEEGLDDVSFDDDEEF